MAFKKIINEDSQTIKDINSLINKLTEENYEKIKKIARAKPEGAARGG